MANVLEIVMAQREEYIKAQLGALGVAKEASALGLEASLVNSVARAQLARMGAAIRDREDSDEWQR
jgi:hypothetical protein